MVEGKNYYKKKISVVNVNWCLWGKKVTFMKSEGLDLALDFPLTGILTLDKEFNFCSSQLSVKWAQRD